MHVSYISPEPKRGGVDGHASTGHGDALSSAQRQSWTAGSGVWIRRSDGIFRFTPGSLSPVGYSMARRICQRRAR
jgi:hypothetical protein